MYTQQLDNTNFREPCDQLNDSPTRHNIQGFVCLELMNEHLTGGPNHLSQCSFLEDPIADHRLFDNVNVVCSVALASRQVYYWQCLPLV